MLDGTPILDIKPYLSSIPETDLRRGWLGEAEARRSVHPDLNEKNNPPFRRLLFGNSRFFGISKSFFPER